MKKFAIVAAVLAALIATALGVWLWPYLPLPACAVVAFAWAVVSLKMLAKARGQELRGCALVAALLVASILFGSGFSAFQHRRLSQQTSAAIAAAEGYRRLYGQYPEHLADAGARVDDGPVRIYYLKQGAPVLWYELGLAGGKGYDFATQEWGPWPD